MKKLNIEITSPEPTPPACYICGRQVETRLGACWECVEAESIIDEGRDMYDKGDAKTAMQKLKMLIEKGWHYGANN